MTRSKGCKVCFKNIWVTINDADGPHPIVRSTEFFYLGSKGDAVVRALASHQCGPGSNPGVDAICGLSLLLVLSFSPRGFCPGTPVFPSPQKPTFSNSNSTRNQVDEEPLCGCATSKLLFIYLFIYFTLESSYVARFRPQKVFPFVNIMRICSFRCDYSTQSCNSRNLLLQQCKTRDT